MGTLYCPRRDDMTRSFSSAYFYFDPEAQIGTTPLEDEWRGAEHGERAGTCSYCGSLNPRAFLNYIRSGGEVVPTDKRYKAYLDKLPSLTPAAIVIREGTSGTERPAGEGWQRVSEVDPEVVRRSGWSTFKGWVRLEKQGPHRFGKFYFQHIAHPSPERAEFYDLVMANAVKLGYPGYWYAGAPLGIRAEHIARHPDEMSDGEREALEAFRERNPGVASP